MNLNYTKGSWKGNRIFSYILLSFHLVVIIVLAIKNISITNYFLLINLGLVLLHIYAIVHYLHLEKKPYLVIEEDGIILYASKALHRKKIMKTDIDSIDTSNLYCDILYENSSRKARIILKNLDHADTKKLCDYLEDFSKN